MAYGSSSKPANQGSAGKPNYQSPKTSGTPVDTRKPGASETHFGYRTEGVGGTNKGSK